MSNKERCKEIMARLFGPASATQVDLMTEADCIEKCKKRVATFLGKESAEKEFADL